MAYTRQEILDEARRLATMVAETDEVTFFKQAEEKVNRNEKVQQLIRDIKNQQKQAVNLQHYGKPEALKKTEAKIESLEKELDDIPIIQEFKQSQTDVNDLLQLIASTISNEVTDHIIESTGGDVLKGTTGSAPGASCDHD